MGITVSRNKLDKIRSLLHIPAVSDKVCLTCGADLIPPDMPCEICGNKQVKAENIIRCIAAICKTKEIF